MQRRGMVLAVAMLTSFITAFTGSSLNLSIPSVGSEFGVSADTVGWIVTGYMLTIAAFSVPFGRLADITSRRRVLLIGIGVFTLCCIAVQFVALFALVVAVRLLQGVSGAMILSTNQAILLSVYPPQMKGQILGYSIGSVYVSLSLGPVIGGILNQHFGWRSIFLLAAIAGVSAWIIAFIGVPGDRKKGAPRSLDGPGNLLFIGFIVLTMYGLSGIGTGPVPVVITIAGLLIGLVFVKHELRADDPALNISLFRNNIGYTLSNVAALMNYGATFAISYLISIYLQVVMGYPSQTAGLILVSQPVIMAILTPIMGRISDHRSPYRMSSLGMGFCAAGTVLFAFVGTDTGIGYIMVALVVTGIGFALFSSPNTNAIMSCVDKSEFGVATSVLNTMRSVGQTLSMVIVTIITAVLLPRTELSQADPLGLIRVLRVCFILFSVMCLVGVFISLKRKRES